MSKIRTHFPRRKSTAAPAPAFTLAFNDFSMTVDIDKLPQSLYKLLPVPIAKAGPKDWKPFCVTAIALGYMR